MKAIIKSVQVKFCLMHFLLTVLWNKEILYCHCFTTLLQNMPSRRAWDWMDHISSWLVLMMVIYWTKH